MRRILQVGLFYRAANPLKNPDCPAGNALQLATSIAYDLVHEGNVSKVTIYHNPKCGTSRNTLALIRNAGIEPTVVEYLEHPPTREQLAAMIKAAGISVRDAMRQKEAIFTELGLGDPQLSDDQLLDAMMRHPILINRPFVLTERGVKLCRPSELVLDILAQPQRGYFAKEDGEVVINERGERVIR